MASLWLLEQVILTLIQSQLPNGATLLGTLILSDKTIISVMTGNRVTHLLVISLTDIVMDFQMKTSNHAFMLLLLLPVPKFIYKNRAICEVLESRLVHRCINDVIKPLKKVAEIGIMMSDPLGWHQYCFTPLVGAIVDTPEALLYAGVGGKTSPTTMAIYKQFSNTFQHEPWTAFTTLAQLMHIESITDP